VLDEETVEGCMREVDVCLHLASVVGVRLVVEQPLDSLLLNARGADTVLTVAARKRRRLLFASTSEVYGKNSGQNLDEDADRILGSARKARWGYALAKSVGEFLASQLYREYDAEMVVVRLFNTVGPRQSDSYGMVLPRFVRQALRGESLTVYGDGAQSRCFTHVTDTVEALLRLTDAEPATGGIFNVGTRDAVPIIELAKRVIERTDSRSTITSVPYRQALGADFEELGQRIPDTSAIHSLVGWRPTRSIDEAIDDVVAEQRSAELVHVLA
jgi:UDP-glucose 4-epimerase